MALKMVRMSGSASGVGGPAARRGSAPPRRRLSPRRCCPTCAAADPETKAYIRSMQLAVSPASPRGRRQAGRAAEDGQAVDCREDFDGQALHDLILDRFGCSYDLNLVHRKALGMNIVALNIMWKHRGQRSFPLSDEEYFQKLDILAEALRQWEQVDLVVSFVESTRQKPRVSKALSIQLDVDEELYLTFFAE